jgi:hypothetical protein
VAFSSDSRDSTECETFLAAKRTLNRCYDLDFFGGASAPTTGSQPEWLRFDASPDNSFDEEQCSDEGYIPPSFAVVAKQGNGKSVAPPQRPRRRAPGGARSFIADA